MCSKLASVGLLVLIGACEGLLPEFKAAHRKMYQIASDDCWLPTGGGVPPSSGSSTVPAPDSGPPSGGSGGESPLEIVHSSVKAPPLNPTP